LWKVATQVAHIATQNKICVATYAKNCYAFFEPYFHSCSQALNLLYSLYGDLILNKLSTVYTQHKFLTNFKYKTKQQIDR